MLRTVTFERGCTEDYTRGLTSSPGEAGTGVYAFVPNPKMRKVYTSRGETLVKLVLAEHDVVDLTRELDSLIAYAKAECKALAREFTHYTVPKVSKRNIQRFGSIIERYVYERYPEMGAYIVPHRGPGIPTGKQVVIRRPSCIMEIRPVEKPTPNAKSRFFRVWQNSAGEWQWALCGDAAKASRCQIGGVAGSEDAAQTEARTSLKGAFARINNARKQKGIPLYHGKKKGPTPLFN